MPSVKLTPVCQQRNYLQYYTKVLHIWQDKPKTTIKSHCMYVYYYYPNWSSDTVLIDKTVFQNTGTAVQFFLASSVDNFTSVGSFLWFPVFDKTFTTFCGQNTTLYYCDIYNIKKAHTQIHGEWWNPFKEFKHILLLFVFSTLVHHDMDDWESSQTYNAVL